MSDARTLRAAILSALEETGSPGGELQPGALYIPLSHLRALRMDTSVVVGGRGVGKSFWTAVLQSSTLRGLIGSPELDGVEVRVGFAGRQDIGHYPNADVFAAFIDGGGDPCDLWRATVLRWIAERAQQSVPMASWPDTVAWLKSKPEAAARLMQRRGDWRGLILFDALDRTSNDWQRMDDIVRGLLRAMLWIQSFPGLHAKVFLREDQAQRTVFNFPDASKLAATRAELVWARHDLHGLLWQRLVNAPDPHGECLCAMAYATKYDGVWWLPDAMKRESSTQRALFERLAGPWMGSDRRRGVPYSWCVSHLADGRGQTSPRSFLAAIRQVAEDSGNRYPEHALALHYESMKRGIQKASEIRVQEMAEDYPWVSDLLTELRGMSVPCDYAEVQARWQARFPDGPQSIASLRLPAQHAERGWDGLREDLQRLGLIKTREDGRIDMPDLYRIGFGLGRRGGVRPRNRAP
ncbi:hypothetical protein [Verminephrobacter aporrectodeae]|uniref:hypothetical protein n=1 Tax=Verminephrobacter aporrectodeae TaxID=1110389 RepID=UPI002243BFD4|nr:hypothetical protein [Verminephrobacter aporrectodeae]